METEEIELADRFEEAVENTTQHIIITDPDGVIVYANAAVEKTTGYPPEEVMGNTPALWGRQMPREVFDNLWHTIKEKKSLEKMNKFMVDRELRMAELKKENDRLREITEKID